MGIGYPPRNAKQGLQAYTVVEVEAKRKETPTSETLRDDCVNRPAQSGDGCDQPSGVDTRNSSHRNSEADK